VATDRFGHLYVVDEGNNRLRKVDAKTGLISAFAGFGGAGDLLIADTRGARIRKLVLPKAFRPPDARAD
jgi:hypothetical protein